MDQVEEIKEKTDMVELVSEYVSLKKAGRNFKGLCPFHGEKTPSFMVNPELQIFKCFGCGAGGDAYAFLQRAEGMEFGEALAYLAKRAGVKLVAYKPTRAEEERERLVKVNSLAGQAYRWILKEHKVGEKARKYLEGRGVGAEAAEKFGLGYAPEGWEFISKFLGEKKGVEEKVLERSGLAIAGQRGGGYDRFRGRLMFPIANSRGQAVGFSGRVLPGADEKAGGKYINTPETEIYHKGETLYGFDVARSEIKQAGWVVLVEGQMDVIASWQAGVKNVIGVGGTALTERQVELLQRVAETLVMALDADPAGDLAMRRGIEIAEKRGLNVRVVGKSKYKDPGEWAMADAEGWKEAVAGAIPVYDFYLESAVERHGLEAVGKRKIGQELLPIWAGIEDEIVKAHYIQKLAATLGVGEEDVRKQLVKVGKGEFEREGAEEEKEETKKRTVREVVEERLVKLILLGEKRGELTVEEVERIRSPFWARVVEELEGEEGVKGLPAELAGRVQDLLMDEEEFSEREWQKVRERLELVEIEERLGQVKEMEEAARLGRRKAELTKNK